MLFEGFEWSKLQSVRKTLVGVHYYRFMFLLLSCRTYQKSLF